METPIRFENLIERAAYVVMETLDTSKLISVTIIRNIHGQVALLLENIEPVSEKIRQQCDVALTQALGAHYSGTVADACDDRPIFDFVLNLREPLGDQFPKMFFAKMGIAKHSWLETWADQRVWPYADLWSGPQPKPLVVTFYSFKGGMGRTTTLVGVALCLAKMGSRVAIVDLDIEAPGIADVFFPTPHENDTPITGVLDYCFGQPVGQNALDVLRIAPNLLERGNTEGAIYVVPAGTVNEAYIEKLSCLDLQQDNEETLKSTLRALLDQVAEQTRADFILLDSRAGFHEIAGLALGSFSHAVVLLGNTSGQSMAGITQAIRLIANYNKEEEQSKERPFVAFVHGLARNLSSQSGANDFERYLEQLQDACVQSGYYREEDEIPNLHSKDADHRPFSIPFNEALREGIHFSPDMQAVQLDNTLELLTANEYARLAERINEWRTRR